MVTLGDAAQNIPHKIGFVGLKLLHAPSAPLPPALLDQAQALAVVSAMPAYSGLSLTTPELLVVDMPVGNLHRAWCFHGGSSSQAMMFIVDSNTGALLAAADEMAHGDVFGLVQGWQAAGVGPVAYNTVLLAEFPNARVEVTPGGQPFTYADSSGGFALTGLAEGVPVSIRAVTENPFFKVTSFDPAFQYDGIPVGMLTNPITPTPTEPADLRFGPATLLESNGGREGAQVTAFRGLNITRQWFLALQPAFTTDHLDDLITVQANYGLDEFYPVINRINLSHAGVTFATHEYQHYVNGQVDFGIGLIQLSNIDFETKDDAYGEGTADVLASLVWGTPCIGPNLGSVPPDYCNRNLDSSNMQLHSSSYCEDNWPFNPPGCCATPNEPHCCRTFYGFIDPPAPAYESHCWGLGCISNSVAIMRPDGAVGRPRSYPTVG